MTKTKEKPILDQKILKNHLYNTFVLLQMIEQNVMIHDTEVEVHQEILLSTKTTLHKTDIALHLEIDLVILVMTKVLLQTTLDHDMTTTKETRDLIAVLIDLHTNHLIDVTIVTDIDHAHTTEN